MTMKASMQQQQQEAEETGPIAVGAVLVEGDSNHHKKKQDQSSSAAPSKPQPLFSVFPSPSALKQPQQQQQEDQSGGDIEEGSALFDISPSAKPSPLFSLPSTSNAPAPAVTVSFSNKNPQQKSPRSTKKEQHVSFASFQLEDGFQDILSASNHSSKKRHVEEGALPMEKQITSSSDDQGLLKKNKNKNAATNNTSNSSSSNTTHDKLNGNKDYNNHGNKNQTVSSSALKKLSSMEDGRNSMSLGSSGRSSTSVLSAASSIIREQVRSRIWLMVVSIVVLGCTAAAAFWGVGIAGAKSEQADQFERHAADLTKEIQSQFDRYVTAANYVHHFCRDRNFTRADFRSLYEYLVHDGLDFKAVQFDPNVTREERASYEAEARAYYSQHYPHINYTGFRGFDQGLEKGLVPTAERDFYFPIHYMEPIIGNEAAIDLDYYSHISRRQTLKHCFDYGEPAITDRLLLVKDPNAKSRCGSQDAPSYGVVLMHPGVNLTSDVTVEEVWPRDLSSIVLCVPALLQRATENQDVVADVYIHDAPNSQGGDTPPLFLGGVHVQPGHQLTYLDEIEMDDIQGDLKYEQELLLTNKNWVVTVAASNQTYKPKISFVVLGGALVMFASVCLAIWIFTRTRRTQKFQAMKGRIESEKAALILENTRQAARAERELNDFIAHEVRNPVAAAMAACSFVKSAVNEQEPLVDPHKRQETREDVLVIYNSLQFINDLLRNMLDMHRASHKQLQVHWETIDLYHDILQSTAGMIYQRDSKVKVIVECEPQNIFVQSDCLRLKQVILNLARNATKFVHEGFIRLKGSVVDNEVRLAVEDSGIGIPAEKQDLLFAKFQESLDQLSQGTGIGLYLCKNLVELMGGEISLNKKYNSGIPGNPGTSIVINLKKPPVSGDELTQGLGADDVSAAAERNHDHSQSSEVSIKLSDQSQNSPQNALHPPCPITKDLPEELNVLFVDDDAILRKLFSRSVRRVAPNWTMREASNGESALQLLDEGLNFDIIFVDQYMASIEKQLLGTETVLEMRQRGATCRVFGLSANDLEAEFIAAGADGFVIKPFPTETEALKRELSRCCFGPRGAWFDQR